MTPRSEPSDDGFTLIELIISVFILGLVFVAILGAMATTITASNIHRKQADVDRVALSAAERIKSADVAYIACAQVTSPATPATYAASYLAAAQGVTMPSGWVASTAVTITSITYETRSSAGTSFSSTCYDANGIKVQQIVVTATSPDSKASASITFLKSGNT